MTQPTLRRGDRGNEVKKLQLFLNYLNCNAGAVDGDFGPATEAAVKRLQRANGLTVDGIVGPITWQAINVKSPARPEGEPVYYSQRDGRWTSRPYTVISDPRQTIGSSGCGPTCAAMIVSTWVNPQITPVEMCAYALKKGFRTNNSGTAWGFFRSVADEFGLSFRQTGSISEVAGELSRGALVVASMGPGYFTRGGHYILLWGRDQLNNVLVHDPASKTKNKARLDLIGREGAQYFIFSR